MDIRYYKDEEKTEMKKFIERNEAKKEKKREIKEEKGRKGLV